MEALPGRILGQERENLNESKPMFFIKAMSSCNSIKSAQYRNSDDNNDNDMMMMIMIMTMKGIMNVICMCFCCYSLD